MLRFIALASLAGLLLTACSEDGKEASFVSEAKASPRSAPDYGWRVEGVEIAPQPEVKDYY